MFLLKLVSTQENPDQDGNGQESFLRVKAISSGRELKDKGDIHIRSVPEENFAECNSALTYRKKHTILLYYSD